MNLGADEIKARYWKVEYEADKFGRIIGVHRLRPAQRLRISEMTEMKDGDGLGVMIVAASVCEMNDMPIPFPKSRAELDSIIDTLDQEGLETASNLVVKLMRDEQQSANPVDDAKN